MEAPVSLLYHKVSLLLWSLKSAMAKLGGSINKLQLNLFPVSPAEVN